MSKKIKVVQKLMGISYAVLSNKFYPRYIRCPRVSYESMAEYTTEKCSILTYFGNKTFLENKKNVPARTIKFSKKDDKLMIF